MDRITPKDFDTLLHHTHPLSISLYVPTDEVSAESQKNIIKFKNLVNDTLRQLSTVNMEDKELIELIKSINKVIDDEDFWRHQSTTFCMFISPEMCKWYRLPIQSKPLASVSHRFHLKPLVPLVSQPQNFYLLEISKNQVQMYKGDRYEMKKVKVKDMPGSIQEALALDMSEKQLQFHTGTMGPGGKTRGMGGRRPAQYHGQATWKDEKQKGLDKFLHRIEKPVDRFLKNKKVPLLLATDDKVCSHYVQMNNYPYLITDTRIDGKVSHLPLAQLHTKALEKLQPYFKAQEHQAVDKYLNSTDDKVSDNLVDILREATLGKIDTVFVAKGVRQWGEFNPRDFKVYIDSEKNPNNHDLYDLACAQTLLNGGQAYVLSPDEIPDGNLIAAVLRY